MTWIETFFMWLSMSFFMFQLATGLSLTTQFVVSMVHVSLSEPFVCAFEALSVDVRVDRRASIRNFRPLTCPWTKVTRNYPSACLQVRLNAMELCEAENSVKLQRRKRILQEILSTEETYQRHINLIVNVGIKFLKQQLVNQ